MVPVSNKYEDVMKRCLFQNIIGGNACLILDTEKRDAFKMESVKMALLMSTESRSHC